MNIPDHFSESLETVIRQKYLHFFDAVPDSGSEIFSTLDPGSRMEKFGSRIRDKHQGSATLDFSKKDFIISVVRSSLGSPFNLSLDQDQFALNLDTWIRIHN
jgi:hypothetical protein